jgi:hypothetical protein
MDERRLDRLARILGTAVDRRGGLGGLTALFTLLPPWLTGTVSGDTDVAAAGKQKVRRGACLPTGRRCPGRKPRGKHRKKLGCNACCQGHVETVAGVTRCACQRDGLSCSSANECCTGICENGSCGSTPPSPPSPPSPLSPPPPPPPPPTCAEACSSDCGFCLTRADAPLLCVEQFESDCRPCTSDNDCLVPGVPTNNAYCVTSIEFRQTGEVVSLPCSTPGGNCTRADACVP